MTTHPLVAIETSFCRLSAISQDLNTRRNADEYLALYNELKSTKQRVISLAEKSFSDPMINQYIQGCNNCYNTIWSELRNIVLPKFIGNSMGQIHQFVVKKTLPSAEGCVEKF